MSTEMESPVLRLEMEPPNEFLRKKALLELRETPTNVENGLKELKALLEAEKDLIDINTNDQWLLAFLRSCKFYPESARDLIKSFYIVRHKYSEIKNLLVPSRLKRCFDANLISILPHRDQEGRRIIVLINGSRWDHRTLPREDLFASCVLCTDFVHDEPASQINGVVYILDMAGFSFNQTMQYTPYATKRSLDFIQNINPMRVKGFHIVNQPKLFQPIFAAIRQFFSPKFSERILMHGNNYESLHRYIAPECLPKCYGGTMTTKFMYCQETYELLAEQEEKFKELQKYGMKK